MIFRSVFPDVSETEKQTFPGAKVVRQNRQSLQLDSLVAYTDVSHSLCFSAFPATTFA